MAEGEEVSDILRRVTYRRELKALARFFGLNNILRNVYYRLVLPRDGILRVEVGGTSAQFHVRTPLELRCVDPDGDMGSEKEILELLLSAVRPGDAFYDVGANFGLHAVLLAKAVGKQGQGVAFEPDVRSYEHLEDNLALNSLANVRCISKALGDRSFQAALYHHKQGPGTSTLMPGHEDQVDGKHAKVEVVEGDILVQSEKLPIPRLVKIDVEGYEVAVLRGMRRTLAQPEVEFICCEIHPSLLPAEVKPNAVSELLRDIGFTKIDHLPGEPPNFHLMAYKA